MESDELKEYIAQIGEKAEYCKTRHAAVSALNNAIQPSPFFTQHEKRQLQHELEKLKKEQHQYAKQFSSRLQMYEKKLQVLEDSLKQRQDTIDNACHTCPELIPHMDACQLFVQQHEKIASQVEKTKDAIKKK